MLILSGRWLHCMPQLVTHSREICSLLVELFIVTQLSLATAPPAQPKRSLKTEQMVAYDRLPTKSCLHNYECVYNILRRTISNYPTKNLLWFTTVNLLWFTTVKRSVFAEYLLRFTIVNTMVYHSIYYGLLQ